MLIRIIICTILLVHADAIKNPCRKNSPVEFFPHPSSDNHYIQCSRRGDMHIRECGANTNWNKDKKKCEESEETSQIKTLAARHKISKLLAQRKPSKPSVTDTEELLTSTTEATVSLIDQAKNQMVESQKALEKMESESRNMFNEIRGQKIIDQIKKGQMDKETAELKNMMTQQQMINNQNSHQITHIEEDKTIDAEKISRQKLMEALQLKQQQRLLEIMNQQSKERIDKTVAMQRQRENDLLKMQQEQRDSMNQQNKLRIEQDAAMHRQRENDQLKMQLDQRQWMDQAGNRPKFEAKKVTANEQILLVKQMEQHKKMAHSKNSRFMDVIRAQQKREKETQMCSNMTCPEGFRCGLDDEHTLVCLPQ